MKVFKEVSVLFLVIFLFAPISLSVYAADSNIEYTGNSGDFIFEPGSNQSPTDLFVNFKKVMPGAKLTQTITVRNNADNNVKVKLYLRSLGGNKESSDFLNQLQLTVSKVNETPMFDETANETAGLADWTEIGVLYSGGKADLNLSLFVPTSLGNEYQKQTGAITWQFMAIELPVDENPWICPVCNESKYLIVDHDEYSEYVCKNCGHKEDMLCDTCGGRMSRVVYDDAENKEWYYYECKFDSSHHTEPCPQTGDSSHFELFKTIMIAGASLLILLLYKKRVQHDDTKKD